MVALERAKLIVLKFKLDRERGNSWTWQPRHVARSSVTNRERPSHHTYVRHGVYERIFRSMQNSGGWWVNRGSVVKEERRSEAKRRQQHAMHSYDL
ncbi:unnamed protein product [Toxocara canis]|uniref:Uncharacterized protein n=1 Tax=Toxocara canis TaxID=6265 RepID=A0A183UY12_TOXCA|nr:unnamed protein product [Toxocara canis]